MKIEKALMNFCLRVSKASWKFCILTIHNSAVIYPWNLLFFWKIAYFLIVSLSLLFINKTLKVHYCRSENLLTFSSLHKNNVPKVSHYNTFYFLRYARPRYVKYLFTNIRKQKNMFKISLILKKNGNFAGKSLKIS